MSETAPHFRSGRLRRIIKRIVVSVAIAVLLLANYVLSYGAADWWIGRSVRVDSDLGLNAVYLLQDTILVPLELWEQSDLPGGLVLYKFRWWCYGKGIDLEMDLDDTG